MALTQVPRAAAVKLFEELGITTAGKWNPKRLAIKLAKIDQMVDDDSVIISAEAGTVYRQCMRAIETGDEIEVMDLGGPVPGDPPADPPAGPSINPLGPSETVPRDRLKLSSHMVPSTMLVNSSTMIGPPLPPGTSKEPPPKKAVWESAPKKQAAPKKKAVKKTAPKEEQETGTTARRPKGLLPEQRTAYHIAGEVWKKHGTDKGITDAMIADFRAAFKKVAPGRDRLMLSRAWHVLRGFGAI